MRSNVSWPAAVLVLGLGIGVGQVLPRPAELRADPEARAAAAVQERGVVDVVRQVSPAVVSISQGRGSGSGVIVRDDGIIITNAHVVGNARQVRVQLADGRQISGSVLGRDPGVDIAVVRAAAPNLAVARVGDSDALQPGQSAIAIGDPLGLDRTVTTGVISAVNRSPRGLELEGLVQTDAAINPGNSGGPLLDSSGRVVGINTVIYQGAQGLGFAIPINLANDVVEQILTTGRVRRSFLGINYVDLDPELARQVGFPVREGIIIRSVGPGSPAARAGLRPRDIVTQMGEVPITRGGDLRRQLRVLQPGTTVTLRVYRGEGVVDIPVQLGVTEVR